MGSLPVRQRPRIHLLQAGCVLLAATILFSQPLVAGGAHEFIEMAGLALVVVCIAGRMWSTLYIGARKNRELVTAGPYSISRNPLYLFSTIGVVGVGLMFGSATAALGLGLIAYFILAATAGKEAEHLRAVFGSRYDEYAGETPLFWPNLALYRDVPTLSFSPHALKRTFADGLVFLAVFPAIEAVEHLHETGVLPTLARVL
jgi:protein-S-isoprenylcysteine O-methyltransferase Ste14